MFHRARHESLGALLTTTLLAALASAAPADKGKKVFAHYMVGDADSAHRQKDIQDAKAVGIDGFSLNIGKPDRTFVRESLDDLFKFGAEEGFGLHISMDLWAAGDLPDRKGVTDYKQLFTDFLGKEAYEIGANGFPMVTTFSDGGTNNKTWEKFRSDLGDSIFLIPDFDGTDGYYTADPGWWAHWGEVVDGLFSWEAAWPLRAGKGMKEVGDIEADLPVIKACKSHKKYYMIGLSALQYKDAYKTNIYRAGHLNLPKRMENILAHRDDIQYVNVVTWNDGPESHYVGNIWSEQNSDEEPAHYMHLDHKGWLPLIASFIAAFKGDGAMKPLNGAQFTGAYWYKTITSSTTCNGASSGLDEMYLEKPENYATAKDLGSYAIVLADGAADWSLRVTSGDKTDTITGLKAGLNYGDSQLNAGVQRIELIDSSGTVVAVAAGGRCVYGGSSCPDCTYNVNPQVLEFKPAGEAGEDQSCDEFCPLRASDEGGDDDNDPSTGNYVFIDPIIWDPDQQNPVIACEPPCTFVLPPETLESETTISIPPATETIEETWPTATNSDDVVLYTTKTIVTVITIPAITTNVVSYSNVIWRTSNSESSTDIIGWYSISVPGIRMTDKDHPEITWTYSYGPWPPATTRAGGSVTTIVDPETTITTTNEDGSTTVVTKPATTRTSVISNKPGGDDDDNGTNPTGGSDDDNGSNPTGGGDDDNGSDPTDSDGPPPSTATRKSTVKATSGSSTPTCTADCGNVCVRDCGPPGIKIPPVSISIPCIGSGCGGGGGGSNTNNCVGSCGGGGSDTDSDCDDPKTASNCYVSCPAEATKTCETSCYGIVGCDPTGVTSTVSDESTQMPASAATAYNNEWVTMADMDDIDPKQIASEIESYWSKYDPSTTSSSTKTSEALPTGTTTYDCDGSGNCGTILQVKYCDKAVNNLIRNDDKNYGDGKGISSNCWGNSNGDGCVVFITGDGCVMSGNEMWWMYQDLREKGNCDVCGSVHFYDNKGNKCRFTVNYNSGCDNRS